VFVLGIDPGLSRCGYGAVEERPAGGARPIAVGVLTTAPSAPLPIRLAELQLELRALIAETKPDVVVVERVFFQVNVRTAMSVGQASGLAMAEAINAGCEVAQYGPNEVKQAVAGWGAAGKDEMERMVQMLLGISKPLRPVDAADAVALALCHLAHAPRLRIVDAAVSGVHGTAGR
jgi:crossover junction endodeoxyribonuclease RuvC